MISQHFWNPDLEPVFWFISSLLSQSLQSDIMFPKISPWYFPGKSQSNSKCIFLELNKKQFWKILLHSSAPFIQWTEACSTCISLFYIYNAFVISLIKIPVIFWTNIFLLLLYYTSMFSRIVIASVPYTMGCLLVVL